MLKYAEIMGKRVEYGLLDALSTCAAKAGLDPRIAGQYSPDRLLLVSVQHYLGERAKKFVSPSKRSEIDTKRFEIDARVFIGAMVVEEGWEVYTEWRQSVVDKMAAMSTSVEMEAA